MAGYSAYGKVDVFALLPLQAFSMASTTFVGQNIGAGNIPRAKKGIKSALLLSIGCTVVLIIPMMLFAPQLISLFNSDPEVIYYGALYMRFTSPFYLAVCINQILVGALRGSGDTRAPMFIMLGSFVVFRQIYLLIFSRIFVDNFFPIIFAYPAGWILCSVLVYIYYKRSHWEHRRFIINNQNAD
jgi:Na+-driven multidrug efflux pump